MKVKSGKGNPAAVKKMAHKVAELLEGGVARLVEEFDAVPVKHAETRKSDRGA